MTETKIENHAHDSSTINNAESIIFNMLDNMLKYYLEREIAKDRKFKEIADIVNYIVNNDALKKKFRGNTYMYEELICALKNNNNAACNLDDGYKSTIFCISTIAQMFELKKMKISSEEEDDKEKYFLSLKEIPEIHASVLDYKLKFYIDQSIDNYRKYSELRKNLSETIKKVNSIIECASQYGNFLVFSNTEILYNANLPFIEKDVKFRVSNDVIPNLIKPLYGESPECGLREIIQNACDACKQRIAILEDAKDQEKYFVEIHLNKAVESNWELIVKDYGVGMDEQTILDKYFVVGESSKRDLQEMDVVGQFGIGALAAFLLGDIVEVKTYAGNENNVYNFKYQCEPNYHIEIKKSHINGFAQGTEVKIVLNINSENSEVIEKN